MPALNDAAHARLALAHAATSRQRAWREAIDAAGSIEALLGKRRSGLREHGIDEASLERFFEPDEQLLARWAGWLEADAHRLITIDDPDFPPMLAEISDTPVALWLHGRAELLPATQLAVVGSRSPTTAGADNARRFAAYLSRNGLTITSGLALGIDGSAHYGALGGIGSTVAVLGTGIDIVYPRAHEALAQDIAVNGLLVSEYPPGTPARKSHFPQRNRIIAGLGAGVLVVEASRHSGSLITAKFATNYGREVFAIPGSIHNPLSRGAHWLIREGAKLVEEAADILIELGPYSATSRADEDRQTPQESVSVTQTNEYSQLLEHIAYDPRSIDELVGSSGLTAAELSSMLLLLELEGRVEALPGGRYARRTQE